MHEDRVEYVHLVRQENNRKQGYAVCGMGKRVQEERCKAMLIGSIVL